MNTLQLYISKSSGEARMMAEINPTDDGRKATADVRSAVALVDYPATEKNIFLVVVNVAGGYAIHIVRTIPPTRPNHLDATIYVDRTLDVMSDDLREIIEKVSAVVLAKSVTEADMAALRELFACEYDSLDKAPRIKASRGRDYACVTYADREAFDDLLDEGLYRPEWSDYRGVIVLSADMRVVPNSVVMLSTDEQPEEEIDDDEPTGSVSAASAHDHRQRYYTYVLGLPIVTAEGRATLNFEFETERPLTKSPVQGYELVGRPRPGVDNVTRLRRVSGQTFKERIGRWLWGLSGLVAGVIIMSIFNFCSDKTSDSPRDTTETAVKAEQPESNPAMAVNKPADVTAPQAVAYLDANKVWRLDDMERIPELRGLFDDLNNFRLEQIANVWADRLTGSQNFDRVVKAARKSLQRNIDPRRSTEEHNPAYNRTGDTAISWLGYTYWIDP